MHLEKKIPINLEQLASSHFGNSTETDYNNIFLQFDKYLLRKKNNSNQRDFENVKPVVIYLKDNIYTTFKTDKSDISGGLGMYKRCQPY